MGTRRLLCCMCRAPVTEALLENDCASELWQVVVVGLLRRHGRQLVPPEIRGGEAQAGQTKPIGEGVASLAHIFQTAAHQPKAERMCV